MEIKNSKRFKKNFKSLKKSGVLTKKDQAAFEDVMRMLSQDKPLDKIYMDHPLHGELTNCRECHLRGNLLLIYIPSANSITLVNIGTHQDLFN